MSKRSMVISLIGRPNVGKSSLFNRLMKHQHKAITHDMPGVTRDRHYGIATFGDLANEQAYEAILVDTGGFYPQEIDETTGKNQEEMNANKFFNIMTKHAEMAIEESDLVLFVADVREGVLPFDESIVRYIRSQKKDFWVVCNKYDSDKQAGDEIEFYNLGIDGDQLFATSSAHGIGIQVLRERIHQELVNFNGGSFSDIGNSDLQRGVTPREEVAARMAIIGAPNAGKSTLLNLLVGAERALVSDIAGTTVDPIEGFFDIYFGSDVKDLKNEENLLKHDGLLYKQYEDFRKNNPNVYDRMVESYNVEEYADKDAGLDFMEVDAELDELVESSGLEGEEHLDHLYDTVFSEEEDGEEVEEVEENDVDLSANQEELTEQELGSYWRSIHLVDTAGIRRQKSVKGFIEEQSVYRSLRCITESDIVIYMIDAVEGMSHQDRRLLDIALDKGKSVIICLNKIDLLNDLMKDEQKKRDWIERLRDDVPWLYYCDLIPISAKRKKRIKQLKAAIKRTVLVRNRTIQTGALNRAIFDLIEKHPIVTKGTGGKRFKVKYASMVKTSPPTFLFFTNKSKGISDSYKRYIKNGLRQAFPFDNTPIHLIFRTGNDLAKRMKKSKFSSFSKDVLTTKFKIIFLGIVTKLSLSLKIFQSMIWII